MRWRVTASDARAAAQLTAWVEAAGIRAMVCTRDWPAPEDVQVDADALLLGGGGDLADAPGRYVGAVVGLRGCRPDRDAAEMAWFRAFVEAGRPVFGICRGLQVIAVALGGRLIPDLRTAMPNMVERHEKARGDACHGLRVTGEHPMSAELRSLALVNSSHHQAVGEPGAFVVGAVSEAGVVEAIESPAGSSVRAFAVQWHPERLPFEDPASRRVVQFWREEARR